MEEMRETYENLWEEIIQFIFGWPLLVVRTYGSDNRHREEEALAEAPVGPVEADR